MKPKYSNKLLITGLSALLLLSLSCSKFVQVAPPDSQLVTNTVFNNSATATSALFNIYTQMFNNAESFNSAQENGLLSDELTNYSGVLTQIDYYRNSLLALYHPGGWDNFYNYIYQANAIIAAMQNNGQIPNNITQQLTGEAKFIRAYCYFYLTNMYGDVPLATATLYTTNQSLSRTTKSLVYTQLIQDLLDAENLLNENYLDVTDTIVTTERIRANKAAAEAMLARAYLYTGKYDSAKMEATKVITNGMYSLCTNLSPLMGPNSVFLMNSTEAILQIGTPSNSLNTPDAQSFILLGAPSTQSILNSTTISPQLMSAFEPGDLRASNWIGSYISSAPADTFYFPFKYQAFNGAPQSEYTMVLRLAEQFLIRAEAEAQLGDMADAATDLNVIRSRASLPPSTVLTASSTVQQADTAILHERQTELFTEWGHRWFDLIRTNTANSVMGAPGNVCQFKGGVWSPNWQLYPIPQTDIIADPHLMQNPGYN